MARTTYPVGTWRYAYGQARGLAYVLGDRYRVSARKIDGQWVYEVERVK
ncbi:MAG TPA: hypothetical protein VFU47_12995 [Armatimonadota bacterium]|nr:hypothetical protein [Armatimonadota bacterium]